MVLETFITEMDVDIKLEQINQTFSSFKINKIPEIELSSLIFFLYFRRELSDLEK